MHLLLTIFAGIALFAWLVLLFARGGFWRAPVDGHLLSERLPADQARVVVHAVVPARNEAETVGDAIASLAGQDFNGSFRIFLADDQSVDGTGEIARAAAAQISRPERLEIVRASEPPAGWTGKLHAMECGVRAALNTAPPPDYWLFTDADIRHDPQNVCMLVDKARREHLAMVSLMVRLRCASAWERLLIPAFVFFFQKLYPFAWVNDARRDTAAAAGGCILLSHEAFARMGGLSAIRDRLIDDCSLAQAVKGGGGAIWLGLTNRTESIRSYDELADIWSMVKRTAYTQLRHSLLLTGGTLVGMTALYIVPVLSAGYALFTRDAALGALGAGTLILQAVAYSPTLRAYDQGRHRVLTLPFAAALYAAMTVDSALAHLRKRGGVWKGRYNTA